LHARRTDHGNLLHRRRVRTTYHLSAVIGICNLLDILPCRGVLRTLPSAPAQSFSRHHGVCQCEHPHSGNDHCVPSTPLQFQGPYTCRRVPVTSTLRVEGSHNLGPSHVLFLADDSFPHHQHHSRHENRSLEMGSRIGSVHTLGTNPKSDPLHFPADALLRARLEKSEHFLRAYRRGKSAFHRPFNSRRQTCRSPVTRKKQIPDRCPRTGPLHFESCSR